MQARRVGSALVSLLVGTLVLTGCDQEAGDVNVDPSVSAARTAAQPSVTPLLELGYTAITAPGGTSFVITFDLEAEPNTTYDVRLYTGSSPDLESMVTTDENGRRSGTKRVRTRGTYTVEVFDESGSVVVSGTLEVE